jgi:transcriptional regulator
MYLPVQFEENRLDVLRGLVRSHPLGLLITNSTQGMQASSIPFLIDEATPFGTLRAHVARANPVWRDAAGNDALVVFQGPQAYISPSWYPSKLEHGKVVPTWDYVMVQARGKVRAVEDAAWLHAFVSRLTNLHEATQPKPWAVSDAPVQYIDAALRAIVGIEIELVSLTGKWKVGQHRPAADRAGIVEGLATQPGDEAAQLARQMQNPGVA